MLHFNKYDLTELEDQRATYREDAMAAARCWIDPAGQIINISRKTHNDIALAILYQEYKISYDEAAELNKSMYKSVYKLINRGWIRCSIDMKSMMFEGGAANKITDAQIRTLDKLVLKNDHVLYDIVSGDIHIETQDLSGQQFKIWLFNKGKVQQSAIAAARNLRDHKQLSKQYKISHLFEQQTTLASPSTSNATKSTTQTKSKTGPSAKGINSPEVEQLKSRTMQQLDPAIKQVITDLDKAVKNEDLSQENYAQALSAIIGSLTELLG